MGLNLFPSTKADHGKGQIRWVETRTTQPRPLLEQMMAELTALGAADPEAVDISRLVCPQALADFLDFNDLLKVAKGALEGLERADRRQIASFHPGAHGQHCEACRRRS